MFLSYYISNALHFRIFFLKTHAYALHLLFTCLQFQDIIHLSSIPGYYSLVFNSRILFTCLQFQDIIHVSSIPGYYSLVFNSRILFTCLQFQDIIHLSSIPGYYSWVVYHNYHSNCTVCHNLKILFLYYYFILHFAKHATLTKTDACIRYLTPKYRYGICCSESALI